MRCLVRSVGLLLVLLLPMLGAAAPLTTQMLDSGWQFRLAPGDSHATDHPKAVLWQLATVPGTVQTDLMATKLVADPFYRDNEAQIQWVGLSDWQYRTSFNVDHATLARQHVELVLDGLDTFADVYLNGEKLIAADNMFRRWLVPVASLLHEGANTLEVRLYSPIKRLQPWLLKQSYALPGEFDSSFGDEPKGKQTANYIRKANYQYGWDWGPRIVAEGIWKDVHLDSWDATRVADFHVEQTHIGKSAAQVNVQFDMEADVSEPLHVSVDVIGPDGRSVDRIERDITVAPGGSQVSLPLRIADPKLWYPTGYGAQDMYTFKASIRDAAGELYEAQKATGLRTIELRRQKDQWGRSFEFVINGIPVFAKGANLIPFDSFPTRVTDAQMRHVLESARDANMNMLRLWGGGYYESDRFYEMADRLGIMIWQEFMFGGAIPPNDVAYTENVRQEAIEQVKRLRDHPSIVLWCGNNEVQTGWETWSDREAFKKTISADEQKRIAAGMVNLFGKVLRNVVMRYDSDVPYWASSPSTDYDGPANVLGDGDYHYWDVWSGDAKPVTEYLNVTPRFQSEYGLQSFPVMRTIRAFAEQGDQTPESPVMRAHQKYDNGNGNKRLMLYITRSYGEPRDFPAFVYLSQVMQANGIQLAAEHLRASRPQSMGSLYWQLNDVWPGASWSSIDYYGRWKALQFHARRFYAPLLIAALRNDGNTTVSLVSDRTTSLAAYWRMRVMDFDGKVLSEHEQAVILPALASTKVASYTDAQLLQGADPHTSFVVFELVDGDKVVSRNRVFFDEAKNLQLPVPQIRTQLQMAAQGYALTLTAGKLARDVWVSFGDLDAEVSDNAFDILPGQSITLVVRSKATLDELQHALQVQNLANVMREAMN
ncbi:glycoside hydrolase family 2 protein [Rhodanobacter sp. C05]|uniref:beta-mannosidase n=1 Tax=Rhodanobacter sp. C05 TaxID=1945855 RepID=UPI0009860663|nr:glycoside hydrolase family 2 protein [Rhodanobacter sp. C05]OOG41351.1 beta-mannosidase [Rhodanobacter sp. C05]